MTEINKIKDLLVNVQILIDKNDEIARLKGEKFNVFSILEMATKENKLHSRFIKELLDVKGSHGLGTVFLDLFIEQLNKTEAEFSYDSKNSKIKTEHSIGKVNNITKTGGRIDLFLSDNTKNIIIENKIHANEQETQLERYCNYAKTHSGIVFYLTLFGKEPKSSGSYEAGKDFFILSYSKDIINWLEQCKKEANDFPILRETIKQYIIILKKITEQLSDNKMDRKVKSIILDHYESAKNVKINLDAIENDIKDFWDEVVTKIKTQLKPKSWKVNKITKKGYKNIIVDVCNNGRGVFAVYIQDILTKPYFGIWYRASDFKIERVYDYFNNNNLSWNRNSEDWLYTEIVDENFSEPDTLKKIYNEERELMVNKFAEKIVEIAVENETHIKEIRKFGPEKKE